jgi:hypothetical protein
MIKKGAKMLDKIENKSIAFWQEPEQAIILKRWNGSIELVQENRTIIIDQDCIDEFIKAIRQCVKMEWEKV